MNWSGRIRRSAIRDLRRIADSDRTRIMEAIEWLSEQPLRGAALQGPLRGLRRLRIGKYRVLYKPRDEDRVLVVVRVAARGAAYRRPAPL